MANAKEYISLYQFSQEKETRYQYFNQMFNNGKIPKNILAKDGNGKLFIHKEKGDLWWDQILAARVQREEQAKVNAANKAEMQAKKSNQPQFMIDDPTKLLEMIVTWFDMAGQKQYADPLKKVLEQLKAEQE